MHKHNSQTECSVMCHSLTGSQHCCEYQVRGRSVVYAPLGLGFRVRVSDRVRVRSVIFVSFTVRVRVMVSADIW